MDTQRYISQSALTRLLGVAPATLRNRIATGIVKPDGELFTGARKAVTLIFRETRIPEIAARLVAPKTAV